MNCIRPAIGWGQFLGMVLLAVLTARSFRKERLEMTGRRKGLLFCAARLFALYALIHPIARRKRARSPFGSDLDSGTRCGSA